MCVFRTCRRIVPFNYVVNVAAFILRTQAQIKIIFAKYAAKYIFGVGTGAY